MFGTILSVVGAIVALGFMVTIHEFGHFLMARYFDVRVDVFSFGFGPRLFGMKRGATDYRISLLPLGGYVRMAGDNISEELTGAPDEFLSKPRWQRALIAVAGPATNVLAAIIIFAIHFGGVSQQSSYVDKPMVVAAVPTGSFAEKAGIQAGDQIVEINGSKDPTWERGHWEFAFASLSASPLPVTLSRNGESIPISIPSSQDEAGIFGCPNQRLIVDSLKLGQPADRAGFRPGDEVVSVEGNPVNSPCEFRNVFALRHEHLTKVIVSRGGHAIPLEVRAAKTDAGGGVTAWTIGLGWRDETVQKDRGVFDSIGFSLWFNSRLAREMVNLVGKLFVGKASLKSVQGPLGIVTTSSRAAKDGFRSLAFLMALISLNLAVINLLPISPFDGGHIIMLAVEGTLRHDVSLKAKERFIQVGFVFILVVFALVMYNDVLRLFQHS